MFISNDEKKYLFDQIKALAREQSIMASDITFLKAKLKTSEGNILVLKQIVEFNRTSPKPKKPKTAAQKAKQAEYMRKYTARKRAEKLALEQK
jgi:hypothetical protein